MEFVFSILILVIFAVLMRESFKLLRLKILRTHCNLSIRFEEMFERCQRSQVRPHEWPRDEVLLQTLSVYFSGVPRPLWVEPIQCLLNLYKKYLTQISALIETTQLKIIGVFIVVICIRIGLSLCCSKSGDEDWLLFACCIFLSGLSLIGLLLLMWNVLERECGGHMIEGMILKILKMLYEEELMVQSAIVGVSFYAMVRQKQEHALEGKHVEFERFFNRAVDTCPALVFLVFCLLSGCFLFFPILGMMQEVG